MKPASDPLERGPAQPCLSKLSPPTAPRAQDERLAEDLPAVLEAAAGAGVCRLAVNGCWEGDWGRVLQLAQERPGNVVPNLGLHPW